MEPLTQIFMSSPVGYLLVWGVLGVVFVGVGLLAERLLRIDLPPSLTRTFWIGWCASVAVLTAICLAHRIDGRVAYVVVALGVSGFVVGGRNRSALRVRLVAEWPCLAVTALAALWLAGIARGAPQNGDSFLYHLPAVDWAERYAAVPGLGNLHGRLAFNNASTLYLALLDGAHRGFHFAHGLLVLPLFARGLPAVWRLLAGRRAGRDALDAVLLAYATDLALGPNLASASPDLPAGVLEAVIASELMGWLETGCPPAGVSVLALLGVTLITVKLSGVGFAAGVALVIGWMAWRDKGVSRRLWTTGALLFVAVAIPWTVRGVVLSGYPAYPSTLGGVPVEWRIPEEAAVNIANLVRVWGRRPGVPWTHVLGNSNWFGPWLRSMCLINREFLVPVTVGLAVIFSAVVLAFRGSTRSRLWLVLVPTVLELGFWFATSPDPRFAGACFWLLPATGLAVVAAATQGARSMKWTLAGALTAVVAFWPLGSLIATGSVGWVEPNEPHVTAVHPFHARTGLVLEVPEGVGGCWGEARLLCTPMPDGRLTLRRSGDLGGGFVIDESPADGKSGFR